jgi:transposase InsO family protein
MCTWLSVSKSGYYEWRSRPQSAAGKRRELMKIKVRAIFEANNEEYGYRRVHQALVRGGEDCCPEVVRSIMRELGLEPCQPKPWRRSLTEQDGQAGPIPDLVRRDFTAENPGQKMVGDITYIETWEGWLYLATVIDCATRKIVGWAMDDNYRTPLIVAAVEMASRNLDLPDAAVFHSDRGSNYTSGEFAKALKRLKISQSVGRTGICPLTGQSLETCRSATRRVARGCLPGGDGGDTPVRHEHGGLPAAA